MIGQTISHYRILEKLGEGGMGVVYRAQDTHLDRTVAIKVLAAGAVANPERKKRFVQEAKTASALNHPNIITIYDIDAFGGVDFIAMECVEGNTLDHFIGRRGLGMGEVLKYGIEIADALAAAHAAGIVHRDLKPGNLMVTEKGHIKVLDFGLAKLTETADHDDLGPTQSMTLGQSPRTEEGAIVGTVAYMSPEQAGGKRVDRRSDIFSFGSVLYEMITGRRPFQGDNKISTLAAILQQEAQPAGQVVPALPRELDRITARCLRKDPDRRFQYMDDVRVALQEMKEESESGRLPAPPVSAPRRSRLAARLMVGALLLSVAAAGAAWWLLRPKPTLQASGLIRLTSDPGLTWDPALSPDGKLLAYSSDRGAPSGAEANLDVWVQQVAGGEPIRLTRDPADDRQPAFSSDGSRIAFRSDRDGGGIYVVPALGGESRLIAKDGHSPHFSPDNKWIAYWVGHRGTGDPAAPGSAQAYIAPSDGGPPRQLQADFSVARYPIWSPDGKYLLFWGRRDATSTAPDGIDWWVAPLGGGPAVTTEAVAALSRQNFSWATLPGAWTPDGRCILFSATWGDSSNLWQLAIDPRTWKAAGAALPLTVGTSEEAQPSVVAGPGGGGSLGARLVFSSLTSNTQIWSLPINANTGRVTAQPQRLTQGPASASFGSLSADGKRLVFSRSRAANQDIWMKDLESGQETDLTPTPADEFHPRISADGSRVAYSVTSQGKSSIYVMAIGSGPAGGPRPGVPEKMCDDCLWTWGWSRDGKRILFAPAAAQRGIAMLSVGSGEKTPLLDLRQHNLYQSNASPDDRWVAFLAHVGSQRSRLYIAPFRPAPAPASSGVPGDWIPVTVGEGRDDKPRWSPDGNLLYFTSDRDGFRCLWAQRLDGPAKRPSGLPFAVYHFHNASRSMMNVSLAVLEPAVARDRIIFNLGEVTGNIWMANLEARR